MSHEATGDRAGRFDPAAIERRWTEAYAGAAVFRADASSSRPKFSLMLPGPSVSGPLHMGHAVSIAVLDLWARYKRMAGFEVLFLPATDHAAIATQHSVERELADEGIRKEDLGRAAFDDRAREWCERLQETIYDQCANLGASLDRSRTRFTMDPDYSRAVRVAFKHFWDLGWIYRDDRVVNWCHECQVPISDMEVEEHELEADVHDLRIAVEGEPPATLTVPTTRPELLPAATAVVVDPDDARHAHVVGRLARLPLDGRVVPIVADRTVRRTSPGQVAALVTPGHSVADAELADRIGLPTIDIIGLDGRLDVPMLARYHGVSPGDAGRLVVADLTEMGAVAATRRVSISVGHCDRCGSRLEPLASPQWYLRTKEMAARTLSASDCADVRWFPSRYRPRHVSWLRDIRDWCVSRQLWFGHRIPIYTCPAGHTFATIAEPSECPHCGNEQLDQDPDVLDTWFSSALWTFATLGWPDDTDDLRAFAPTSIFVTTRQVIGLGISRMMMVAKELTDRAPFGDIAVTCVTLAPDGRLMKSWRGNVVDPLAVSREYGADALRTWAVAASMASQDARYDETRVRGLHRFATRLWASAYAMCADSDDATVDASVTKPRELADRWILSRLQSVIADVTGAIEAHEHHRAVDALYDFGRNDFCGTYHDATRRRREEHDPVAASTAAYLLDGYLRLLHPFMPFLTEELWHILPGDRSFLVQATWPEPDERLVDFAAELLAAQARTLTHEVRRRRRAAGAGNRGGWIVPTAPLDPDLGALVEQLANVELVERLPEPGTSLPGLSAHVAFPVSAGGHEQLEDSVRPGLLAQAERLRALVVAESFVARAPEAVQRRERERLADVERALADIDLTSG